MRPQFSIAALLILTAIVAVYLLPDEKSWTDSATRGYMDANHNLLVQYGVRGNKLLFVAIAGELISSPRPTVALVNAGGSVDNNWHVLQYPDGTEHRLPISGLQLFQFIDGQWAESEGDVTPDEFFAYFASRPAEFSIESLLTFVLQERLDGI